MSNKRIQWTLDLYNEALRLLQVQCPGPYVNMRTKTLHTCLACGDTFTGFPDNVRRGKTVCNCKSGRRRFTTTQYNAELSKLRIALIGEFSQQKDRLPHLCLGCSYEWLALPDNVLHGHGCPACSKDKADSGWKKRTEVKIGKRVVRIQGYEPLALEYLKSVGCNLKKLCIYTDEGKPTFTYALGGKKRLYIPDFYYPPKQRVVEVKSLWTFLRTKEEYRKNVAKAKAVISSGYRYALLLMTPSGDRIPLPKEWFSLSYKDMKVYLEDLM